MRSLCLTIEVHWDKYHSTLSHPNAQAMRRDLNPYTPRCRPLAGAIVLHGCCVLLATIGVITSGRARTHADEPSKLEVRVEAPVTEVLQAVKEVTQDQIIHGTYSYDKERILYGAQSAGEAHVFGRWQGQGTVFYKVANKVLSPRYFKDSEDIGTISVRYVVQEAGPDGAILQIDAVFVDARNVHHSSLGNVESSEYAAIQEHLRSNQAKRLEMEQQQTVRATPTPAGATPSAPSQSQPVSAPLTAGVAQATVPEMQKRVEDLRHQVELRVKDEGAQLKAAPFHGAATLQAVPAQSEVLVVILSPYWYGVETEDGHRGWIHHSQLEPLP